MVVLGVAPVRVGVVAELDSLSPLFCGERVRVRGRILLRRTRLPLTPTLSPLAGRGSLHTEPPGHTEVHDQDLAAVEMHEDILGAAVETLDLASGQTLGEALR
jgi:hypothetical protein